MKQPKDTSTQKCGIEYPFGDKVEIKNLKRHLESCRKDHNIGKMILSQSQQCMFMHSSKFVFDKFHELITYTIIKYDLLF